MPDLAACSRGSGIPRPGQPSASDPAYDGVAKLPGMALADPPVLGRHQANALTGDVDVKFGSHPKPMRHRRNPIDARFQRDLIEVYIATILERLMQIERTMAAFIPTVKPAASQIQMSWAIQSIAKRYRLRVQ